MMVVATMLFAFATSCNGNEDRKDNTDVNMSDAEMKDMKGMDEMQSTTSPALNAYMDLKNSLVEDNAEAAQKAAKDMMQASGMSDEMKNNLGKMAESADLKEQRKYFSLLSSQLYEMGKRDKITDQTLYWTHCPMAMDGEGANWLSMGEKIRNPYMGQRMPGCGSVQETIKK
jgi:DNA-binding NtrC family response regulator